jgi:hypothetical protein
MYKIKIQPKGAVCWNCSHIATPIFKVVVKSKHTFDFHYCSNESFENLKKTGNFGSSPPLKSEADVNRVKISLSRTPLYYWVVIVNNHDTEIEIKTEMKELQEEHLHHFTGISGYGLNGISGFGISEI